MTYFISWEKCLDLIEIKLIVFLFSSRKQSITVAEIDIVYHSVSYYDILLLEEAIYVNNTLDDLQVNGLEIDSNSGNYPLKMFTISIELLLNQLVISKAFHIYCSIRMDKILVGKRYVLKNIEATTF